MMDRTRQFKILCKRRSLY